MGVSFIGIVKYGIVKYCVGFYWAFPAGASGMSCRSLITWKGLSLVCFQARRLLSTHYGVDCQWFGLRKVWLDRVAFHPFSS
jgi:hypothetical protein